MGILTKILILIAIYGDVMVFNLNKSERRTSSVVRSGVMKQEIYDLNENQKKISMSVHIKTFFMSKKINKNIIVSKEFFEMDFWERLREMEIINNKVFKIKHIKQDRNCDVIKFYDFKKDPRAKDYIENGEVMTRICHNEENVYNPTYIDVKGSYNGISFKAGFDRVR